MKRFALAAAIVAMLLPTIVFAAAGGICHCAATNSSTQTAVLAAFTGSASAQRRQLCLQNVNTTAADYVACDVGNTTAVAIGTGIILPAQSATSAILVPPFCFPPAQYSSSTFPSVPNGTVNCIAAAGTPTVCACTY